MSAAGGAVSRTAGVLVVALFAGCRVTESLVSGPVATGPDQAVGPEERVEFNPSGPTTIRMWRGSVTGRLLKVEFVDARSGEPVFTGARLIRNELGHWRLVFPDGSTCALYQPADPLPHSTICVDKRGMNWAVLVQGLSSPRVIPGTATEDEFKLTVSFTVTSTGTGKSALPGRP